MHHRGGRFRPPRSVSITPRPCHSEPVTDVTGVGIRNLLAGNPRKSAGIMHFGNGLPRQSSDWLAMTGFFDSLRGGQLCPPRFLPFRAGARRSLHRCDCFFRLT